MLNILARFTLYGCSTALLVLPAACASDAPAEEDVSSSGDASKLYAKERAGLPCPNKLSALPPSEARPCGLDKEVSTCGACLRSNGEAGVAWIAGPNSPLCACYPVKNGAVLDACN